MSYLDSPRKIKYDPETLVIDLTRTCNAECAHCILEAGPSRKETLDINNIRMAIQDAVQNHIESISFYGGEPFIKKQLLYESLREVCRRGFVPQIMTNGFWGKTEESTNNTFDEIKAIQEESVNPHQPILLIISIDKWHQKNIPVESIANIISAWIKRKDLNIQIELIMQEGDETDKDDELLNALQDEIDKTSGHLSAGLKKDLLGEINIRFIDKIIKAPQNLSKSELLDILRREEMLDDRNLRILEENQNDSDMGAYELININGWIQLFHDKEDIENKTHSLGRLSERKVGFHRDVIKLLGRASAFLNDPENRTIQSKNRKEVDHSLNGAERQRMLILGVDNKFYVHPVQMTNKLGDLGENNGRQIAKAIASVNNGDVVSNILITEDIGTVIKAVEEIGDEDMNNRLTDLINDGFEYEAIVMALSDKRVIQALQENP